MLFREKILLSNCDSVRALGPEELRQRVLLGLTFADGVVLTPAIAIDNPELSRVLQQYSVRKYLSEEGAGKLVVRGPRLSSRIDLHDYFLQLPDNHIFSSISGAPRKSELSSEQRSELLRRLDDLQGALGAVQAKGERIELTRTSLQDEIAKRLASPEAIGQLFADQETHARYMADVQGCISRSDWYAATDRCDYLTTRTRRAIRAELIDPAYNSLFVAPSEGFLQDNIRYLSGLPPQLLDASVNLRALRRELALVQYPIKLFKLVSSLATDELLKLLTAEALDYVEGKMLDKGLDQFTRRNWFGLYPKLRRVMGLEIK